LTKLRGSLDAPVVQTGGIPPKYQTVFGEALVELAEMDENIVGITPAMPSGSSLWPMIKTVSGKSI
jgi:deoxyxylulose-5-phosphate synthase